MLQSTATSQPNPKTSSEGEANHLCDFFDGQIDEFSILSERLTLEQVEALYNTGGQTIIDNGGTLSGTVVGSGTYELQIAGQLADTDSSETLTIIISARTTF